MKSNNKPKQSTNNKKRIIGDSDSRLVAGTFLGLILVLVLSVFCSTQNTYATASSLSVSVSIEQDPSVNVAPTADGRFISSGTTTFSVSTTHAAGYKVTATSTALKDSTNTISTLTPPSGASGVTADNYNDSEYASKNSLNNTWGYLPSKICTTSGTTTTCAANTLYLPAPISSTQTLDEVKSATNNTYDINIGTRVTTDTAQGAYATTFTVAVVGNATSYAITYNKNTTDTVSNMPTNHTTSDTGASGETVTLASSTPTRAGYTFNGWCTVAVSDGASCTGTSYAKGGTWTLNQTSSTNSLTLYAMWKADAPGNCTDKATCLQSITTSTCPTTATKVTDARDGEEYYIQKLADNRCWMLDNLRLDPTSLTQAQLYGTDDQKLTNASNTTLGYLKNGGGSSPYTTTAVVNKTSSFTSYNLPYVNVNYKNNTTTGYGSGSKKVGVYYNYCAASAGSYCYSSSFSNGNASEDLCPTGWRMPTGGSSGEYYTLKSKYSSTTATNTNSLQYNLSTPLSGYFYDSSQGDLGSVGLFWSSTRYNAYGMYGLSVYASNVDPTSHINRNLGYSMRCVAQ